MMQRLLLISAIAAAGLLGYAQGTPRLAATLPLLGFVSVSRPGVFLLLTVSTVLLGAHDLRRCGWLGATLPALLTAGIFLVKPILPAGAPGWLPVAALVVLLPAALYVVTMPSDMPGEDRVRALLFPVLVYATALLFCGGMLATRWRALFTCPLIGAGGMLLALVLWRGGAERELARSEVIGAAVVGFIMAQAAWALLFWPAPAPIGGAALLAVFYAASGALAGVGQERVHWRTALEYAIVGVVALAAVIWGVLRAP